jgi:preprotein translocase subunit SecA
MVGTTLLKKLFGTSRDRDYKRFSPILEEISSLEPKYSAMTNDELRSQTALFRERLANGETLDDILTDAYAVVRETSKRVIGLRPFDVQIYGAVILHRGNIAEMMTGEGKTLVATMPVYLNALTGDGVHLITVNDYLARRDSQWMGPIFEFLGLTVGLIQSGMNVGEKQAAYRADVTYGTNNEYGFDYLRDNMAVRADHRMQRKLNYAIVDEVDSILIDEARTPLIISGRPEKSTDLYYKINEAVCKLKKETHYELEEKGNHATLTEEGMEAAEKFLGVENLYTDDSLGMVHMIEQSIKAHHFYKKDDEYVLQGNDVIIVDEFTGRLQEGRRFGDGLHQAIEAKERVSVQFESQTVASITYQNFFKIYDKLAGMTGTAMTEAQEFANTYKLEVFEIEPNLPLQRADNTDLVFATENGKFNYVIREIEEIHKTNRPVLVGTVSIEKSEKLAKMISAKGISGHQVLNAKHHEHEASIISTAGKPGAITIATNMAGRGTDIKLGEGVRELGGLAIIGTERHESRRIDNQLRGRAGRQGDPGTTRFYVSLEDDVARLFGGDRAKKIIDLVGGQAMDEEPLDQKMVTRSIEKAQKRVEQHNFEIRKQVVQYDDVMNKQRQVIYKIRRDVLEDKDVLELIQEMFEEIVLGMVDEFAPKDQSPEEWDLDGLASRFKHIFGYEPDLDKLDSGNPDIMGEFFLALVDEEYKNRENMIADEIRNSYREQIGGDESKIDFKQIGRKRVHDLEMMALLNAVDEKWIVHLYTMDYLKESVRMRALGQRDPLLEYKQEGFDMFQGLLLNIYETVIQTLFRMTDPEIRKKKDIQARKSDQPDELSQQLDKYSFIGADKEQDRSFASFDTSRFALAGQENASQQNAPRQDSNTMTQDEPNRPSGKTVKRVGEKLKPNDPCSCGSGKKYKKCCGAKN